MIRYRCVYCEFVFTAEPFPPPEACPRCGGFYFFEVPA